MIGIIGTDDNSRLDSLKRRLPVEESWTAKDQGLCKVSDSIEISKTESSLVIVKICFTSLLTFLSLNSTPFDSASAQPINHFTMSLMMRNGLSGPSGI